MHRRNNRTATQTRDIRRDPFAQWTRKPTKGATLELPGRATDVVTLSRDAGKARDQIAALLRDAPKEVREAAVEADATGLGDVVAKVTISNERVDSYDSTLAVDGWDVSDFQRNPVVLYAHDQSGVPVGRDIGVHTRAGVDGAAGALIGVTRFVSEELDPFGAKIARFVQAGILRTTSVGFEPLEFEIAEDRDTGDSWFAPIDFTRQRLREYSWCAVPANPDCLVDGARLAKHGITRRDVDELLERAIENTDSLFVPRRELVALKRAATGTRVIVDLGALGSFQLTPVRAPVAADDNVANPEAYADDEDAHPEDDGTGDAARAEGDMPEEPEVMLMCPDCGTQRAAVDFVVVEPEAEDEGSAEGEPAEGEGMGEGEGELNEDEARADLEDDGDAFGKESGPKLEKISTAVLERELARRQRSGALDSRRAPGHDDLMEAANVAADLVEDLELETLGRLP
jgi:phage head maturation protease